MTHANRLLILGCSTAVSVGLLTSASVGQETVELSILVDNAAHTIAVSEALAAAFEAENPHVSIDIETRPGGGEGDNIVKTRLATGQMNQIFWYNSGSLLQALNPDNTLVDLSDEPFMDAVQDVFLEVVSTPAGAYGVPTRPAEAGGIFYNREIYADLGLDVPLTWDDFMANNESIAEAGITPVIQTYGESWTSQLLFLADYHNLQQDVPDFAELYTSNEIKIADTPAALRGFERLLEVYDAGYFNADFGAATYADGLRMLVEGEGAHYPMLYFAVPAIADTYPDLLDNVGFFAQPGDDEQTNGLTVWMPAGFYIPQTTTGDQLEAAKAFLGFVASPEGCDVQTAAVGANGPYLIDGCELPGDVPPVVQDLVSYFEEEGKTTPALEFLSPIKGPMLEQLTVEVGSGIRSPEDAAALYDQDVARQAQQLGIEGW